MIKILTDSKFYLLGLFLLSVYMNYYKIDVIEELQKQNITGAVYNIFPWSPPGESQIAKSSLEWLKAHDIVALSLIFTGVARNFINDASTPEFICVLLDALHYLLNSIFTAMIIRNITNLGDFHKYVAFALNFIPTFTMNISLLLDYKKLYVVALCAPVFLESIKYLKYLIQVVIFIFNH